MIDLHLTYDRGVKLNGQPIAGYYRGSADTDGLVILHCQRQGFDFHSGDPVDFRFVSEWGYEYYVPNAICTKAETVCHEVVLEFQGSALIQRKIDK